MKRKLAFLLIVTLMPILGASQGIVKREKKETPKKEKTTTKKNTTNSNSKGKQKSETSTPKTPPSTPPAQKEKPEAKKDLPESKNQTSEPQSHTIEKIIQSFDTQEKPKEKVSETKDYPEKNATEYRQFTIGNVKYEIDNSSKSTVILASWEKASGSIEIPSKINYNGVEFTVTKIGKEAFENCKR